MKSQQVKHDGNISDYCHNPPKPANGQVSCVEVHITSLNTQFLCTYICDSGYKFKGLKDASVSRLCADGNFTDSSVSPQCVSVCSDPDLPSLVTLTCQGQGTDKLTCKPECVSSHQFESIPEGDYECQTGGKWFPDLSTIPKCVHSQRAILNTGQSVCSAWGQDHYRTFDNTIYTFKGRCKYVLAYMPNTFSIMVVNDQACLNSGNCKRDVEIYFDDNAVALRSAHNGSIVVWNNRIFPVPGSKGGTVIERVGNYITVRSSLKFYVKWDGRQSIFVKVPDELRGQISGLCGRFSGDPNDDFENDKGNVVTSVASFGTSWKKTELDDEVCPDSAQAVGCPVGEPQKSPEELFAESRCADLLSDPSFIDCHVYVDPSPYIQACKLDCCDQNSNMCACETMEAYSRACMDQGLVMIWRKPDRCEVQCPGNMVYKECGSSCIPDCSNTDTSCSDPTCVDGCFCPDGWVLHKGRCIEINQCPCTHGNRDYTQGNIITEECNSCECMSGRWNCTHNNCDAVCSVMGDPHYTTFDGKRYDFMGSCSYYLVQTPEFSIIADNIRCGNGEATCTKSLSIEVNDLNIKLDHNHQLTVDGHEIVKLPYEAPGIQISMISSLFMQVVLSNRVSVLWDGVNRANIKVPPSLKGKTQGLCGTYDGKQTNDFLTPQGSYEINTNLFGNQWKTSKDCEDVPLTIAFDPCEIQSQRKAQASGLCGILINSSSPFEVCHYTEDVTQYYKDCMYDLCSCAENIQNCLCPSLAAYADSCAAKGVKINWRSQVKECSLQCPGGQVYQVCRRPCEYTCHALAQSGDSLCDQKCVEGCSCPEGQSLNNEGECVAVEKCPCTFDGHEYPAGFTTLKGTDICVCAGAQWQCTRIRPDNQNITRVQSLCPDNMEYSSCAPSCPVTCQNVQDALTCPRDVECKAACVCKDGYVFDGDRCILPSMCPCYHGGKAYYEGDTFFVDCNECVCKNHRWQCQTNDCPATCSAYGDSHYTTFDGRKYEFQGSCDYIMAKSTAENPDKFLITTTNLQCGTSGVACSKGIEFISGDERTSSFYRLQFVRGQTVKPDPGSPFYVREVGEMVYVTTPFGVTVQWDKGTRVYVKLAVQHIGKVEGLCGNFNGDQKDDFQIRSGGLPAARATSFGDSWRVHSTCETSKEVVDTCVLAPHRKSWAQHKCSVIASDLFKPCHALVEPKDYIDRCEFDACGCDIGGDCECLCTAIAAYAHDCASKGSPIRWRSKDLCGLTCTDCEEYNPCVSLCPKRTCANNRNYSAIYESCEDRDMCFEGCDLHPCPEGQVYDSLTKPVTCVPEISCLLPSCFVGDKIYMEGARIDNPLVCRSDCEICNCHNGEVEHITFGVCTPISTSFPMPDRPTESTVEESPLPPMCTESGWTGWMSASVPTYSNIGDQETSTGLREKYIFCADSQIIDVRCRVIGQHEYGMYYGQKVTCDLNSGLVCNHRDQAKVACLDYEVSYRCDCDRMTPTPHNTSSATSPVTPTHTRVPYTPQAMCNWTQWMNSYKPSELGDIESISNLRLEYSFCAYPTSITCRTVPDVHSPQGIRYDHARQLGVSCDLNRGLVCLNSAQNNGQSCYDYEVAVKCEDGCHGDESTLTTPAVGVSTTVTSTSVHSSSSYAEGTKSTSSVSESTSSVSESTASVSESTASVSESTASVSENTASVSKSTVPVTSYPSVSSSLYTVNESASSVFSTSIKSTTATSTSSQTSQDTSASTSQGTGIHRLTSVINEASSTWTLPPSSEPTRKTSHATTITSSPTATSATSSETASTPSLTSHATFTTMYGECNELFGVYNKFMVGNDKLEASSSADAAFDAQNGRLNNVPSGPRNGGAWKPRSSDPNPHLVIDLDGSHTVAGVVTQGRPGSLEWVTSFKVYFLLDNNSFVPYMANNSDKPMLFTANNDSNSIAMVYFDHRIKARKIAIYPVDFSGAIAMRLDLLTCDGVTTASPNAETSTTASTEVHFSSLSTVHTNSTESSGHSLPTSVFTTTTTQPTTSSYVTYEYTTEAVMKCTKSHWFPLINRNTDVTTHGDREILSTEELVNLCRGGTVTKIRCYDFNGTPSHQTGEIVECDLQNGFTCSNSENGHICKDYSITYWCECDLITSTQTTPVSMKSETASDAQTTFPPTHGRNTTELHIVSTTSTNPTISSSSAATASSTSKTTATSTSYRCESGWSQWINRNVPTLEYGEHEKMNEAEKRHFCTGGRISSIECENDKGIKAESDPKSSCTVQDGLSCAPQELIPGWDLPICDDYKVRYYCEVEAGQCSSQQQSTSTTPSLRKNVTCGWSDWLNSDSPSSTSSDPGDLETIESLKSTFIICPDIVGIECRVAGSSTSVGAAGQAGVKCDIINGLRCYNRDTEDGICYDYEVRVFCWNSDVCSGSTPHTPVETTTNPLHSTTVSSTVICPPGRAWDPCAYKCEKVCHYMGHVTGACSDRSLEGCVPGCKSVSSFVSNCSDDQRLRDSNTCVDPVACTCLKPDGTIARPFEIWEDRKSACTKCSCINNEVICNSEQECSSTVLTTTTVMQPLCGWSLWINDDKPETGNGDVASISALRSLCSTPIAVECRDAVTHQDVHMSGQNVTCTSTEGLLCLNANNGGRCKDYEIRVFCPCSSSATSVTDYSTSASVPSSSVSSNIYLSTLLSSSSALPSSTSLPTTTVNTTNETQDVSGSSTLVTSADTPSVRSSSQTPTHTTGNLTTDIKPTTGSVASQTTPYSTAGTATDKILTTADVTATTVPDKTAASTTQSIPTVHRVINITEPTVTSTAASTSSGTSQPTSTLSSSVVHSSTSSLTESTSSTFSLPLTSTSSATTVTSTSLPTSEAASTTFGSNSSVSSRWTTPSSITSSDSTQPVIPSSISTLPPGTPYCGWSEWMSYHTLDALGDMETVSGLRKKYTFCENPAILSMRCRDKETKKSAEELGQVHVLCTFTHGLLCLNSDQPKGQCADYEVSFFCDPIGSNCTATTTTSATETPSTEQTEGTSKSSSSTSPRLQTSTLGTVSVSTAASTQITVTRETSDTSPGKHSTSPSNISKTTEATSTGTSEPPTVHERNKTPGVSITSTLTTLGETPSSGSTSMTTTLPTEKFTTSNISTSSGATSQTTRFDRNQTQERITFHPTSSTAQSTVTSERVQTITPGTSTETSKVSETTGSKPQTSSTSSLFMIYNITETTKSTSQSSRSSSQEESSTISGTTTDSLHNTTSVRLAQTTPVTTSITQTTVGTSSQTQTVRTSPSGPSYSQSSDTPTPRVTPENTQETTPGISFTTSSIYKVCVNIMEDAEPIFVNDSSLSASSSLSQYSGPQSSRIDSKADNLLAGAWIPLYNSNKQWIRVTLPWPMVISGITTQGRHGTSEWVKTYTALYSSDGVSFYHILAEDGKSIVFTGNADSETKHTHRVKPTEALVVMIQPQTWEKRIALRFGLIGCLGSLTPATEPQPAVTLPTLSPKCVLERCEQNMGLQDGRVRDDMLSASSYRDAAHASKHARIGGSQSWMPSTSDASPYIQVNFMASQLISGVTTQGRIDAPVFVQSFMVNYSSDGVKWSSYQENRGQIKIFYGNWDSTTPVRQIFEHIIRAQYIRIIPQTWQNDIALRFEIHGCFNTSYAVSYPSNPVTISTTATTMKVVTDMSTKPYRSSNMAGLKDCIEWDIWLDLNQPSMDNRDEIEPIADLIANSTHCKNPMAIDCRPELGNKPLTNVQNVSCNLWEGFKCLVRDGNEPMCNNYRVRLGCLKEIPECTSPLISRSPVPLCYPGVDTRHCPESCPQGFYCNGTTCVPKSACPCGLDNKVIRPDGVEWNKNCDLCQCLNGEVVCVPALQCPSCKEGISIRNVSSCDCQCLTCNSHEFQCGDGSCIPADRRCDCITDCVDDELSCETSTYRPSSTSEQMTTLATDMMLTSTTVRVTESSSPGSSTEGTSITTSVLVLNGTASTPATSDLCSAVICPKLEIPLEEEGVTVKILTTSDGCCKRPLICYENQCRNHTSDCSSPMVVRNIYTSDCCPNFECVCPEKCPIHEAPECPVGMKSVETIQSCGCTGHACVPLQQECNYLYTSKFENNSLVPLLVPQEVVYEIGHEWSDGPCKHCKCTNSTEGSGILCTEQHCEPCKLGEERVRIAGSCCGPCLKTGCLYGDRVYKAGEEVLSHRKCYTAVCEKTFDGSFIIQETQLPCERLDKIPFCPPGTKDNETLDDEGCCNKCKIQLQENLTCETCSLQPFSGTPNGTIGYFKASLPGGVTCLNKEPVEDLKLCGGYCSSKSMYTQVLRGFDSQCTCCQPTKIASRSVKLYCSDGLFITKDFDVPETCACLACSSGS